MGAANIAAAMHTVFRKNVFLLVAGLALLSAHPSIAQINAMAPGTNIQSLVQSQPDWLSSRNGGTESPSREPNYNPLRSMFALLAIVGALFGLQYYLRRRTTAITPVPVNGPRILARRKLGMRQELLVVEWEKEQILIAVGPSFATRLAETRHPACERGNKETTA